MHCVYHANYSSTVLRRDDELLSQCVYLSTDTEAIAMLRVEVSNFHIRDARWDVYRSPGKALNGSFAAPELKGYEAFMNVGPVLRQLGEQGKGLAQGLFAECVRGLVQAETFVWQERGYASAQEYDEYWQGFSQDYCRYFTHIDRIAQPWRDYVGEDFRDNALYNRMKSAVILQSSDRDLLINANFIDSFHELTVNVSTDLNGIINNCTGNYLRAPDQVCFENSALLGKLAGRNLTGLTKKDIARDLGFSTGCTHLVDLVSDISQAYAAARG